MGRWPEAGSRIGDLRFSNHRVSIDRDLAIGMRELGLNLERRWGTLMGADRR